ncbi:MAG: AsmA family protein [Cyanobacteria bacterium KgW148]|nr:AsmA family protein [Cyanobacteria bacterium KgW148]
MARVTKITKIILGFVAGLVLAIVLAIGIFWFKGGELVSNRLAPRISAALGTPAQIDQAKLNPIMGTISIPKIAISNPSGLNTPYFMEINNLDIKVKNLSLLQPTLQMENFSIDNWNINIEQTLSNGNISEIAAYIQKNKPQPTPEDKPIKQRKILSSKVTIGAVNTKLRFSFLGQQIDREFKFDDITLTNLTQNETPIILDEYIVRLVSQTLKSILIASKEQLQQNLPKLPDLPFLKQDDALKSLQKLIDQFSLPAN